MEAREGQGEEGMEPPGSSQVPPIATTPPRPGWKEELLSQSSSGTHVSNASGISLGEAIRRQSAVNRDMETWYQPYAEIDTSHLLAAIDRSLGQTSGASGLTEVPTIEGGSITPTEASRRQHTSNLTHTPLLEVQDSRLSPNLPLRMTYSTQSQTFNETLFQPSGFAPLRGIPDTSAVGLETSRPLQMKEAERVAAQDAGSDFDCSSLSQHPFALSTVTTSNASPCSYLSQYPFSFSRHVEQRCDSGGQLPHFVAGNSALVSTDGNLQVLESQEQLNQPLATPLPPAEPQGTVSNYDLFLLDSSVPAPLLLEILEKEVGLSKHDGFLSSSESSSCKSVSGKDPEKKETSWITDNMVLAERKLETFASPHQQDRKTIPEADSSEQFSDSEGKLFTNASVSEQLPPKTSQVALASKEHNMGLGDSCINTEMLPRPLLEKQQLHQVSEVVFEGPKQGLASAMSYSMHNSPAVFQPLTGSAEFGDTCSKRVNAAVLGIQTGVNKNELTLSNYSIEREHKYTGISPSFTEGSFFGHLAHPINHSTPGIVTARASKQIVPGVALPMQSVQPPLHVETSSSSHTSTCVPSVEKPRGPSVDDTLPSYVDEPLMLQSDQEAKTGNSESPHALHPLKGRIQSLPSLSFMEKVGIWNMSQSAEKMSDALALQSLSSISPKQKAYRAIADSLNRILLKQQSQIERKEGLAASFNASSTASLHSPNKKSLCAFPLTRSRSENSVIAVGQEILRADFGKEVEQEDDFQPAEDKDAALGTPATEQNDDEVEDPLIPYTAVLVSTVLSDEDTVESVGEERNLNQFITSKRVAELLQEKAISPRGDQEKSDGSWGDAAAPLCAQHRARLFSMDHYSDVSPDSLNQRTSSVASSRADMRLSLGQPSALSGESDNSLEGVSASQSPVLKTPDGREMNIEERIPVYLRNLGIDQSPSSILTPFLPRGPIREIEFSPSELRTMKASTDALRQHLQASSEGDSHCVMDVTLSSFDSSTLSVPVPEGSEADPNTSLPADLLPKLPRDLYSPSGVKCHQGELHAPTPHPPESISEPPAPPQPVQSTQVIPAVPPSLISAEERAPKCVLVLVDRLNSKELGVTEDKLFSSSLSEEKGKTSVCEEPHSLHVTSQEEEKESFIGSKTLKEIQELLTQAEAGGPSRFSPVSSLFSSADLGGLLTRMKKVDGCGDFRSVQENSPSLQRIWSWDETLTRQNVHEDNLPSKALKFKGSLKWEGMLSGDNISNEPIVPEKPTAASQEVGQMRSAKRSEPEGCNSAMGDRNLPLQPAVLKSAMGSSLCSLQELPPAATAEPLDSVSGILGGFQHTTEKAEEGASKGTGSIHGSENSSSVDSLGIRVKNVLQGPIICAEWGDRNGRRKNQVSTEPSLAFSRETAGVGDSDSSSVDSLAARVKALLGKECPVRHAAQILQRAEEEERKVHIWVKQKLAAETTNSVFDLNEEDKRKVEAIKTELLLSAQKVKIQDQLWGNSHEGISSHNPTQKPEMECSVVPRDTELQMAIQSQNLHIADFPVHLRPWCGTDFVLPSYSEVESLNSVQSYICTQPQTRSDSNTSFHAPLGPDSGTCLVQRVASEVHTRDKVSISSEAKSAAGSSSTEAAKQITSITFASRKRSSSPPASPVPSAGLSEAVPRDQVTLEAKSIGSEQVEPSKQSLDALHPCTAACSTATCLRDNVGFSSDRQQQPASLVISRDESPPGKDTVSEESSQTCRNKQKVHFCVENCEEAVDGSQVLTGLRGNDRILDGVYDKKDNPEGKGTDRPLSVNLSQQKTENNYLQDQVAGSCGSSVHIFKPFSPKEESMLTTESAPSVNLHLSRLGDADTGNTILLPCSSPDHISTIVPMSPSSPTRKALSGVHITLSPKRSATTQTEMRQSDVFKTGSQPETSHEPSPLLETTSKLKPSELFPKTQDSIRLPRPAAASSGPSGHFHSSEAAKVTPHRSQELLQSRLNGSIPDQENARILGSGQRNRDDNLKITVSSQTERLSSDAITQITTESPDKTTYSAEIFVSTDSGKSDAVRSSHSKRHEIPSTAPPALNRVSSLNRQAGTPLLLPYKPPGSSEMYYVPCPKETLRLSRVRSETTVESSHSGSNDANPPDFPTQVLGLRDKNPQNAIAVKHKEGIYSKRILPKVAWAEGKTTAQEFVQEDARTRTSLESVQATRSVFRSGQFYLHPPVPLQHEIDFFAGSEALEQSAETEHSVPPSRDFGRCKGVSESSQSPFPLHQPTGEQRFSPLIADLDYSLLQEPTVEICERDSPKKRAQPDERQAGHQVAKQLPLPGSQMSHLKALQVADVPQTQSVHFTGSLDELWSKYLERRRQQQQCSPGSNRKELSLVERLDRLARLLQNPVRHSLMPAKDEQSDSQENGLRKEPKKMRSHGKAQGKGNLASQVEERHDPINSTGLSRRHKTGDNKVSGPLHRLLEQTPISETPSDTSSEMKPGKDSGMLTDISASESDAVTQEETAPLTEASSSVSSIDTDRLIRAFGHGSVCVSPKLSQLYNTISLQKTRSEKWPKGSRRAPGADLPKMAWPEHKRKSTQAMYPISFSDSASTSCSSRGPNSALSNKRTTRMLNKAVQAGDFEIVNSATKKHTRDVGLTFPTPTTSQVKLQGGAWNGTEDELTPPDGLLAGGKGKQKRQTSGLLAEKRTTRNKLKWLQGVSWFVPAEVSKSDPKKETRSGFGSDPGPSCFEPLSSAKPWREPLREKNWQEDPGGLQVRLAAPVRDVENEPPPRYVKMSLQEALALHRPDFISRSGARVKRLKLIMEERKLQSVLQSEREQLFNPPEERRAYQNGHCLVSNRGYRTIQRARSIPKNEMVQRSKRIYEQLPEVQKRREEEKRRSDYSSYRLKAQLYKTKITNRILGRKVPWE